MAPMIRTMRSKPENMYKAAQEGFINATDLADYLVRRGQPFRTAYKTTGQIVAYCIEKGLVLDNLRLEEYKKFDELFEKDLYSEISLETCVEKRISKGGTGEASIKEQIAYVKDCIK